MSPDGTAQSGALASSGDDGRICTIRGVAGGEADDVGHEAMSDLRVSMLSPHGHAYVRGLAWSPTGKVLFSGGWDGTVTGTLYNEESAKPS